MSFCWALSYFNTALAKQQLPHSVLSAMQSYNNAHCLTYSTSKLWADKEQLVNKLWQSLAK